MKLATTQEYARRLARVDQAIEDNLDAPLSPTALAKVAAFAPHHFHRIFRAQRGETVMQRVRRLRLLRAAKALSFSSTSVLEIALNAGYSSHEAFTRAFTEQFGHTPSVHRKTPSVRLEQWKAEPESPLVDVEIRSLSPIRVGALRHVGPFAGVGQAFGALVHWAIAESLWPRRQVGLCPDDPDLVDDSQLRMDACVVLEDGDTFPTGETSLPVTERWVEGGRYAIAVHRGTYATLSATYLSLIGHWLPTTNELPTDAPILERYLNDPTQTKEADLLTEVCLPLV